MKQVLVRVRALTDYELFGAEGIERTSDGLVIVMARYRDIVADRRPTVSKALELVTKIEDVIIKAAVYTASPGPSCNNSLSAGP